MVAISPAILWPLSVILSTTALVFAVDRDSTTLDKEMHRIAQEYYFTQKLGQYGPDPSYSTLFAHQDLGHHTGQVPNLVGMLNYDAQHGQGVIPLEVPSPPPQSREWGEPRRRWYQKGPLRNKEASSSRHLEPAAPLFEGPKPIYYVTVVPPHSPLGQKMGLNGNFDGAPFGKQALALWRYQEKQINLVAIDTMSHYLGEVNHGFKNLLEVIPLERVRYIVANLP
ncbi:uncharacterized protein UTRI_10425_B [Ustilago trichophora]|uniref:Uncharacterized protein n=1 Tax=Ustilago trichophora TaxID=86804 RepID=A0A5C3EBL2_9BASI|nr:uncharacterized protein UTRI_10425_B [Ustilago trichophora]